MTISRTDTCKISMLRKSATMIESFSIRDKDMNHARNCRQMADKLERKLKKYINFYQ